jgi:PAS domain S-box-containing protein
MENNFQDQRDSFKMKQLVFSDLVDVGNLKRMARSNHDVTGMPIGIVDAQSGQIYAREGWQKICVEFHRKNKALQKRCVESTTEIETEIKTGEPFACTCKNGLRDIGIPVFCLDQHIVTIFLGQFFYDGELPDRSFFISQARRYGLDVQRYMEALDEVPVFSRRKVGGILAYNKAFAEFLSHIASKTELLRQESEKKYKTLVDKMPAMLYSFSPEKGGLYVYGKIEQILGYTPSYLMENPFVWNNSVHPGDIDKVKEAIAEFEAGRHFEIEYRIRDRHGGWHWFYDRSIGRGRDESGDIIEGLAIDVTEQKRIQKALADSEQRLADIIDFLPDPTWVIDIDSRVIAWNLAIERLTGIKKSDMLGKGDYAYSVPFWNKRRPVLIDMVLNRDSKWEKEYLSLKEHDGILIESESYHPHMGKEGLYLSGMAGRLYNAKGDVVGAVESVRDITAAKRLGIEREGLIADLQDAMKKVRVLSGMLPICSSCKKIRDDKGYWNQIETYIRDYSDAEFSHGICPECAKKLYPDLV